MKNIKNKILLMTMIIAVMLTACGKADLQLNNETITIELGTELSAQVTDYVTIDEKELKNVTLDISEVNTNAVGTYTATVTYDDEVFIINVNVVDTKDPVLTTTDAEVEVGSTLKVTDLAKTDDLDEVELTFEDGSDTWVADEAGNFSLVVVATDASGNQAMASVKVVVTEPEPEVEEEAEEEEIVTGTVNSESASGTTTSKKSNKTGNSTASSGNSNATASNTGSSSGSGNTSSAPAQSTPQAQAPAQSNPAPAPSNPAPSNPAPSGGGNVTQGSQADTDWANGMVSGGEQSGTATAPSEPGMLEREERE